MQIGPVVWEEQSYTHTHENWSMQLSVYERRSSSLNTKPAYNRFW